MANKNLVSGYADSDISLYFARGGSVLAFKDMKGRKRICKVVSVEDGNVYYKVGLLSRTSYSDKTWRKPASSFEPLKYQPKYISVRDDVFYVFPSGKRTTQKGLGKNTHEIIHLNSGMTEVLDHPELHWEYLWGDDYADINSVVDVDDKSYLFGVQI